MPVVPFSSRLFDLSFLPSKMTLGDKLFRLRALDPQAYKDIEQLVGWKLCKHWPEPNRWKDRTP